MRMGSAGGGGSGRQLPDGAPACLPALLPPDTPPGHPTNTRSHYSHFPIAIGSQLHDAVLSKPGVDLLEHRVQRARLRGEAEGRHSGTVGGSTGRREAEHHRHRPAADFAGAVWLCVNGIQRSRRGFWACQVVRAGACILCRQHRRRRHGHAGPPHLCVVGCVGARLCPRRRTRLRSRGRLADGGGLPAAQGRQGRRTAQQPAARRSQHGHAAAAPPPAAVVLFGVGCEGAGRAAPHSAGHESQELAGVCPALDRQTLRQARTCWRRWSKSRGFSESLGARIGTLRASAGFQPRYTGWKYTLPLSD